MTNRRFAFLLLGDAPPSPARAAHAAAQDASTPAPARIHPRAGRTGSVPICRSRSWRNCRSAPPRSARSRSAAAPTALYVITGDDIANCARRLAARGAAARAQSQRPAGQRATNMRSARAASTALETANKLLVLIDGRSDLYAARIRGVFWDLQHADARGHRADRGDQRPGRHALGAQCGQRRHQHHHPRRQRDASAGWCAATAGTVRANRRRRATASRSAATARSGSTAIGSTSTSTSRRARRRSGSTTASTAGRRASAATSAPSADAFHAAGRPVRQPDRTRCRRRQQGRQYRSAAGRAPVATRPRSRSRPITTMFERQLHLQTVDSLEPIDFQSQLNLRAGRPRPRPGRRRPHDARRIHQQPQRLRARSVGAGGCGSTTASSRTSSRSTRTLSLIAGIKAEQTSFTGLAVPAQSAPRLAPERAHPAVGGGVARGAHALADRPPARARRPCCTGGALPVRETDRLRSGLSRPADAAHQPLGLGLLQSLRRHPHHRVPARRPAADPADERPRGLYLRRRGVERDRS